MSSSTVSIIIPTFNRAGIVSRAIDSALAQSYPQTEVIVVDDGSTDETLQILRNYSENITIISRQNSGPAAARNFGVRASKGELVAFLDSDDAWHPDKISRQVKLLLSGGEEVQCCLCNARVIGGTYDNKTTFDIAGLDIHMTEGIMMNPAQILASRFVLFNQVALIRRSAFERVGGFKADMRLLEDYDLAFRLALLGPWAFINEPLVNKYDDTVGIGVTATRDPMTHSLAWANAIEGLLEHRRSTGDQKIWALLDRALADVKAEIHMIRRIRTAGIAGRTVAKLQRRILLLRQSLTRRLPDWPQLKVEECDRR